MFAVQEEIARQVVATLAQPQGVLARPLTIAAEAQAARAAQLLRLRAALLRLRRQPLAGAHLSVRDALEAELRAAPDVAVAVGGVVDGHDDTWRFGYNADHGRERALEQALERPARR
jgi:hypothetical protein